MVSPGLVHLRLVTAFVGASLLMPVACAAPRNAASQPSGREADRAQVLVITFNDNGKTIAVRRGQSIRLELPSQLGTGYRWEVMRGKAEPLEIREAGGSTSSGKRVGQQEMQVFQIEPPDTAESRIIKLQYVRPWDKKQAAKRFEVTLRLVE